MDDRGLPGAGEPITVRFVAGGASNELFEVRRGDQTFALRRPPRDVPPGRNETMLREYRLLTALAGTGVPHPMAVAGCADTEVIGAAFYLMELVDGWSPASAHAWPAPFDSDPDSRRGLAFELVDGLAHLGSLDWRTLGLEGFGRPDGFHERQVDRWLSHIAGSRFREIPGLDLAAGWLRAHRPDAYVPGIMHGDYSLLNVMFRHGAPGRLAAIIDWEQSTIGDPLLDLGWVLMVWPDPGEAPNPMVDNLDFDGMPARAELVERYAQVSGRTIDDTIDYYVVLARFKMACVLEPAYARYVKGSADNPRMEAFGKLVIRMAADAAALASQRP